MRTQNDSPTRIRISCVITFTMACCHHCMKPWALQWLTYWRGNQHALHLIPWKMEARQSNRNSRGVPFDGYRDRYRWYPTPANRVATVGEGGDFLPPNPEEQEPELPGDDPLDGLSTQMTQAMNHFQQEEHCCFICRQTGHFMRECPHKDAFHTWQKQLNFQGVGQHQGGPTPKNPSPHPAKRNPLQ